MNNTVFYKLKDIHYEKKWFSLSEFFLTACGDEYADLRKMTVRGFLDNKPLIREVLDKCDNREIKDSDIWKTAIEAVNEIHVIW